MAGGRSEGHTRSNVPNNVPIVFWSCVKLTQNQKTIGTFTQSEVRVQFPTAILIPYYELVDVLVT